MKAGSIRKSTLAIAAVIAALAAFTSQAGARVSGPKYNTVNVGA